MSPAGDHVMNTDRNYTAALAATAEATTLEIVLGLVRGRDAAPQPSEWLDHATRR